MMRIQYVGDGNKWNVIDSKTGDRLVDGVEYIDAWRYIKYAHVTAMMLIHLGK
jgi:hypothetical protein